MGLKPVGAGRGRVDLTVFVEPPTGDALTPSARRSCDTRRPQGRWRSATAAWGWPGRERKPSGERERRRLLTGRAGAGWPPVVASPRSRSVAVERAGVKSAPAMSAKVLRRRQEGPHRSRRSEKTGPVRELALLVAAPALHAPGALEGTGVDAPALTVVRRSRRPRGSARSPSTAVQAGDVPRAAARPRPAGERRVAVGSGGQRDDDPRVVVEQIPRQVLEPRQSSPAGAGDDHLQGRATRDRRRANTSATRHDNPRTHTLRGEQCRPTSRPRYRWRFEAVKVAETALVQAEMQRTSPSLINPQAPMPAPDNVARQTRAARG